MREHAPLDELLELSCEELQLSPTLHAAAEEHYHAVARWLNADGSPLRDLRPEIYPQGSVLIGTTTKPIFRNEHDLDFVCQLRLDHSRVHPVGVLDLLRDRLLEHGTYGPMVEPLKRCVRLNYAGDFHMDILPAAPERPANGTRIRVPDRKLEEWKASDPKGFGAWFQARGRQYLIEKRADAEPIPRYQSVEEKNPLQRAVQLAKRARDLYFWDDIDAAPRSIVLTTLMGEAYRGQPSTAQAVHDLLASMLNTSASPSSTEVYNPIHPEEVLSEQWISRPETFSAFRRWLDWFATGWNRVLAANTVPATQRELTALFGDELVKKAFVKQAQRLDERRKSETLRMNRSGTLLTGAGFAVRPNTFYGGDDE
jgi:hypothetical protein